MCETGFTLFVCHLFSAETRHQPECSEFIDRDRNNTEREKDGGRRGGGGGEGGGH